MILSSMTAFPEKKISSSPSPHLTTGSVTVHPLPPPSLPHGRSFPCLLCIRLSPAHAMAALPLPGTRCFILSAARRGSRVAANSIFRFAMTGRPHSLTGRLFPRHNSVSVARKSKRVFDSAGVRGREGEGERGWCVPLFLHYSGDSNFVASREENKNLVGRKAGVRFTVE